MVTIEHEEEFTPRFRAIGDQYLEVIAMEITGRDALAIEKEYERKAEEKYHGDPALISKTAVPGGGPSPPVQSRPKPENERSHDESDADDAAPVSDKAQVQKSHRAGIGKVHMTKRQPSGRTK